MGMYYHAGLGIRLEHWYHTQIWTSISTPVSLDERQLRITYQLGEVYANCMVSRACIGEVTLPSLAD